jgi:hypothetical protein
MLSRSKFESRLGDQTHREPMSRPLQFHECRQFFVGTHDETLSVAMRVNNPNCSPVRVHG